MSIDRSVFECIGYMKNKSPGEGEFLMFVNENSFGSTGGFEWKFQDFCPDLPHEYGRIFIHTMSYEEIKRKIIHDYENNLILDKDNMEFTGEEIERMGKTTECPKCKTETLELLGESGEFWLECSTCHLDIPLE